MAETQLTRHPIRAAIWGFIAGIGLLIYLILVWPVIAIDTLGGVVTKSVLVIGGAMLLSVLWGLFGPAKKPKGPAPTSTMSAPRPEAGTGFTTSPEAAPPEDVPESEVPRGNRDEA